MRFRLTELADADLAGIEDWVEETRGADTADRVSDEIDARIREIAGHPLRFPVYQFDGDFGLMHEYRSANAGRFKVFYWVNESEGFVEIWRIRPPTSRASAGDACGITGRPCAHRRTDAVKAGPSQAIPLLPYRTRTRLTLHKAGYPRVFRLPYRNR